MATINPMRLYVSILDRVIRRKHTLSKASGPSSISAIDLAWDNNDTPEEYTVEFQVQFWSFMDDVNAGNAKQKTE